MARRRNLRDATEITTPLHGPLSGGAYEHGKKCDDVLKALTRLRRPLMENAKMLPDDW